MIRGSINSHFRLLTASGTCPAWPRAPAMLPGVIGAGSDRRGRDSLTEIRTTLDLVAAQDEPDLTVALRLAVHRDQLATRNSNIPAELPAVLGHP